MKTEWKKCKLGDIGKIVGGATPSTKNSDNYINGTIPWITPKDLANHFDRYISHGERNITESGLKSCSAQLMPAHSILFSSRAPIGYIAISANEVCTNQGFKSIVPNEKVDYMFLYYLLKFNKDRIEHIGSGTTFKEVSGTVMKNFEITIPPLPVQKKIAGILKSLDDKIELNRQISKNLEEQARCLFEKTFPKNKTFKMLPLSELCTVITKGTTPTTLGKAFTKSGINFIKAESILDNHSVDFDKISFIDDETNKMLGRSIIHSGDIVFTIAGTLGRFALIDESVIPANTNQAVAIIRSDTKIISPEYLYSFFIGNWHNNYYTKRIQQAVQANLSLGTIKSLPIPILEKKEMKSYLTSLTPIFKIQSEKIKENRKLSQIRDTILPKLMCGEIEV